MTSIISVAMATYNGADFLEEQLLSLTSQTILPHELWVTDDGSSDETLDILENFFKYAPFQVRVIQNHKRLGYGRNFLKAASLCGSNYVAFCDQDDVWHENKLEKVQMIINQMSPEIIVHGGQVVDQILEPLGFKYPNIESAEWFKPNQISEDFYWPGYAIVAKKTSLFSWGLENKINDESLCIKTFAHDRWVFEAVRSGASCYQIPDELVQYRQHRTNYIGFSLAF